MYRKVNLKKAGLKPLVCIAIASFQLLFSFSFAQPFSGGDGSQSNPYQIATPNDLVAFSAYVNSDTAYGLVTAGKYFKMTQDIDMASISDFVQIGGFGTGIRRTTSTFYGNFDGGGFAGCGVLRTEKAAYRFSV